MERERARSIVEAIRQSDVVQAAVAATGQRQLAPRGQHSVGGNVCPTLGSPAQLTVTANGKLVT